MTTETETSKYDGHTPGPWELRFRDMNGNQEWFDTRTQSYAKLYSCASGELVLADMDYGHPEHPEPEAEANARLIADAPQLLRERDEARAAARFFASLLPPWVKHVPQGLCPTMYGTGTYEGDLKIRSQYQSHMSAIGDNA